MANSRLERVGTIYTRIKGLMRAGAMKVDDKPIWYDVYEAFPPKNLSPAQPNEPLRPILYQEDQIRARFHNEKVFKESVNLMDAQRQTRCQQFISKYQELEQQSQGNKDQEELFNETLDTMKQDMASTAASKEQQEVGAGDSSLAASFKIAFNDRKPKANLAEILKD